MWLFEWWFRMPWWIRLAVALALLLLSTLLWLSIPLFRGLVHPGLLIGRLATIGWAFGVVLLFLSFPSKSERKGYHDF